MFERFFDFMRQKSKEEIIRQLESDGYKEEADLMAGRVVHVKYSLDLTCFTTMETYQNSKGYVSSGDKISISHFGAMVAESKLINFYNELEEKAFDIERRQREKVECNLARWAPYIFTVDIKLSGKIKGHDANEEFDDLESFKAYLQSQGFAFETPHLLQNSI